MDIKTTRQSRKISSTMLITALRQFPKKLPQSSLQEEMQPLLLLHEAVSEGTPSGLNPAFLFRLMCHAHLVSLIWSRFYKASATFLAPACRMCFQGRGPLCVITFWIWISSYKNNTESHKGTSAFLRSLDLQLIPRS